MKTWIGVAVSIIVAGGGAYWWMQQSLSPQAPIQEQVKTAPTTTQTPTKTTAQNNTPSATVNKSSLNQTLTAYSPNTTSAELEMGGPFGTLALNGSAQNTANVTVMMVKADFGENMDYDALVKWAHDVGSDVYVSEATVLNGIWSVSFKGINAGTYSVTIYNSANRVVLATETAKVSIK